MMKAHFLTYVEATSLNAEALSDYIIKTIESHYLDLKCLVSQGYDGASVMSGRCSGVQQRVREKAPQAIYVHCNAHILKLALVDCSKAVPQAGEFFALLESLYVYMSSSKAHCVYIEKQGEFYPDKAVRQLKRLSDTRWACRHAAVNALAYTFAAVVATLEVLTENTDKSRAVEARGMLLQINSFPFLLNLIVFDRILS